MSVGQFWVGLTDEYFNCGPYDTREEAIANAVADASLEPGEEFYTGHEKEIPPPHIDAEDVIEHLYDHLSDDYAEVSIQGWPNAPKEAIEELDQALNATFRTWHEKHASFAGFAISEIESHLAPEVAKDPKGA